MLIKASVLRSNERERFKLYNKYCISDVAQTQYQQQDQQSAYTCDHTAILLTHSPLLKYLRQLFCVSDLS